MNSLIKRTGAGYLSCIVLTLLFFNIYQPVSFCQDDVKSSRSKKVLDSILILDKIKVFDSGIISTLPPPQVVSTVSLKKDKNNIQAGDQVNFFAELSRPDKEAIYFFYKNNEIFASGRSVSKAGYLFTEPALYTIKVLVHSGHQILYDSLMIEVNRSPGIDTVPPINYNVTLKVRNPQSMTGDVIFFDAASNIDMGGVEYLFNFGDGSSVFRSVSPSVQYAYQKPDYYTASVQLAIQTRILPITSSAVVIIEERLQPNVMLEIFNSSALIGDTITFIASANIEEGLTYEFFLGEDLAPIKGARNIIRFPYPAEGIYVVFVKLYQGGKEMAESGRQEVVIKSSIPPPVSGPDWWIYIAVIMIVGSAGYMLRKNVMKPEFTFIPYPDQGLQRIKEGDGFDMNYEIHFDPNPESSDYQLNAKEENFIKSKTVK